MAGTRIESALLRIERASKPFATLSSDLSVYIDIINNFLAGLPGKAPVSVRAPGIELAFDRTSKSWAIQYSAEDEQDGGILCEASLSTKMRFAPLLPELLETLAERLEANNAAIQSVLPNLKTLAGGIKIQSDAEEKGGDDVRSDEIPF